MADPPASGLICDTKGHDVTAQSGRLSVCGAMLSHPGCVRELNEDTVMYRLPRDDDPLASLGMVALVADGMGGHAAGEVASNIAARTVNLLYYLKDQPVPAALAECFAAANKVIYDYGKTNPECAGMGTTCTTLVVRDNHVWLAHVGDSRAYIVREEETHQISNDHSLVAQLVRDGTLTQEQARTSPERNIILRALGTQPSVEPEIWNEGMQLRDGDQLVLCSDGLCDLIDAATIGRIVRLSPPFDACRQLIDAALGAGGYDNVSVGVFAFKAARRLPVSPVHTTRRIEMAALPEDPP